MHRLLFALTERTVILINQDDLIYRWRQQTEVLNLADSAKHN